MDNEPMMKHQEEAVANMLLMHYTADFDEPGLGKSRCIIEAAENLARRKGLEAVLVICPAQVKFNWLDKDLGEIARWSNCTIHVVEIGGLEKIWRRKGTDDTIIWYIVSYEYLRSHIEDVCRCMAGSIWWMVMDESSYIRNRQSQQHKACIQLRYGRIKTGGRYKQMFDPPNWVTIMNGTPSANGLQDLWGQFEVLDRNITGLTWWEFRNQHMIFGGWMNKQCVGYKHANEFMNKISPHVICRKKSDVLDLPPKTYEVVEVPLSLPTWKAYKHLRDEFIMELDNTPILELNAAVRTIRLAMVCNGFYKVGESAAQEISAEKLCWLTDWVTGNKDNTIIWCWFRYQINQVAGTLGAPALYGSTTANDKNEIVTGFHPQSKINKHRYMVAQPQAGGLGLNLAAANINIYLSCDFSYIRREQSEDRIHRPGQTKQVKVIDVLATGPKGQRTIDHLAYRIRRKKEDFNRWTKDQWRKEVLSE